MKTPIPYGRQHVDAGDERSVARTLRSAFLTQGPRVEEFEAAMARRCGARYAVACSNGTAALHLACMAAGLGPGDEAVTSPITFAATANAVLYCGAKPVFADIEQATGNLSPTAVVKKLTRKTRALLAVHLAGQPCDMRELRGLAEARDITVIEDAAHALGASYAGRPVGACAYSDMTTLSFHPVKHITTGEGGMVLTNRRDLFERLRLLRSHGITRDPGLLEKSDGPWYYEMHALGFNYRITDIQCALGLSQLRKLSPFVARRRAIAARYRRAFKNLPEVRPLSDKKGRVNSYHLFVLQTREPSLRRPLFEELVRRGVQANVHYIPVPSLPYYRRLGYSMARLPRAQEYYDRAISIPMHPSMSEADVARVIAAVRDGVRSLRS